MCQIDEKYWTSQQIIQCVDIFLSHLLNKTFNLNLVIMDKKFIYTSYKCSQWNGIIYIYIYTDSHKESLCQFLDKFVCQVINMKYCIFFPVFANLSVTNIWPRVSTHEPDMLYKSQLIQNVDKEYVTTCYRNLSLVVCMIQRGTNDPFVVEGGLV